MFSPWRYNIDAVAAAMLEKAGWETMPDPTVPTGQELVGEEYLEPLAALPEMGGLHVRLGTRVIGVSRRGRLRQAPDAGSRGLRRSNRPRPDARGGRGDTFSPGQ